MSTIPVTSPRDTTTTWAKLRQVVLATDDIVESGDTLRTALGLGPGFADPELDEVGLADDTIPVGTEAFLELVAPATADHDLHRYLARNGGRAGYCLSVQHPDPRGAAARAAAMGIRVTLTIEEFMGAHIIQLHPRDVGVLLELDGVVDPERWFWDDRDDRVPTPDDARVDEVLGVIIAVPEPTAMARRWRDLLALPDGPADRVDLSGRTVRFVPIGADGRQGLIGVDLRSVDGSVDDLHLVGVDVHIG